MNLDSWQGSVFGFPNPILGLPAWSVADRVGVAILAGARFARWFWWLSNVGRRRSRSCSSIWLIAQSIFVLGTLCPWCMVTWVVTIPTFCVVTLHIPASGTSFPRRHAAAAARADRLMSWVPLLAVVCYAIVVLLAQAT